MNAPRRREGSAAVWLLLMIGCLYVMGLSIAHEDGARALVMACMAVGCFVQFLSEVRGVDE